MGKDFDLEAALALSHRRRHCRRLAQALIRGLNISYELDLGLELNMPGCRSTESAVTCWVDEQLREQDDLGLAELKRRLHRVLVDRVGA